MESAEDQSAGPVRILTHEFAPFTGGIAVYIEETARAAASMGVDTRVWAPDYGKPSRQTFPFPVQRVPMPRGRQDWGCRRRMAMALRKSFPDGRMPGTTLLAEPGPLRLFLYPSLMRLPVPERLVVLLHGSEAAGLARLPHRRWLLGRLLRKADRVAVISSPVGELVQRLWPGVGNKLVRVPGAVRSVWRELPVPERVPVPEVFEILQVGRVHPRKGQHVLLEALARLPESLRGKVRVRLLGPLVRPAYANLLMNLIRRHRIPAVLEGPVSLQALQEAYSHADVLVMPSRAYRTSIEGFGLTLVEAQHFGCAVVGSRIGGIGETLREGETGILVPPDNADALAGALRELLENPERLRAMGMAGSRFVRESFSWEGNVRRLGLA